MPPGRGRGRGRGPGPGPGRGRGRGRGGGAPPPQEEEAAPLAKEEPLKGVVCGFPRCEALPEYGFPDEPVAQCCAEHKSEDMVLKVADPENPKEESLALVKQYQDLVPKLEELKDAPAKAHAAEDEIRKLSQKIAKEGSDIADLTKAVEHLIVDIHKEEAKPVRRIKGPMAQHPEKIAQWNKEKDSKTAKVGEIKGQKELDEAKLSQLKEDLPAIEKPAKEYRGIHAQMTKLKADAVDAEASAMYLACRAQNKEEEMNAEGDVIFQRLLEKAEA